MLMFASEEIVPYLLLKVIFTVTKFSIASDSVDNYTFFAEL